MDIARLLINDARPISSTQPPGPLVRLPAVVLSRTGDSLLQNAVQGLHNQNHRFTGPGGPRDDLHYPHSRNWISPVPPPMPEPMTLRPAIGNSQQPIPGYSRLVKPISKPPAPKRFRCTRPACDARFSQKGSLTRHVRARHDRLRPHFCRLCPKTFSEKWTLTVHVRNVHNRQTPHTCRLCGARFGERWNLRKHIPVVHGQVRPDQCTECSRAFRPSGCPHFFKTQFPSSFSLPLTSPLVGQHPLSSVLLQKDPRCARSPTNSTLELVQ